MSEKPSEWIDAYAKVLTDNVDTSGLTEQLRQLTEAKMQILAIKRFLDNQHDAKREAEKRYRETEPELPY